jgi:hypothetical protein
MGELESMRCVVCMGPPGDDSRRCERPLLPRHRSHLVDGIYYLPANESEVDAFVEEMISLEETLLKS